MGTREGEDREHHNLDMSGSSKAIHSYQSKRRVDKLSDAKKEVDDINEKK